MKFISTLLKHVGHLGPHDVVCLLIIISVNSNCVTLHLNTSTVMAHIMVRSDFWKTCLSADLLLQELRSVRDELSRQVAQLASRVREREAELSRLRSQLSQRPSSPTGDELENRLHTLTQTLVLKQTSLETVTTEKNALRLQLEKIEVSESDHAFGAGAQLTSVCRLILVPNCTVYTAVSEDIHQLLHVEQLTSHCMDCHEVLY